MKKFSLILLIMISKLSFASFPVKEKTTEPEPGTPEYYIMLAVLIAISTARSFQYKKKYGTFYKPWSAYTGIEKIIAYIALGIVGLMLIVLFIALVNPDATAWN